MASDHSAETILPPDLLADVEAIAAADGRRPDDIMREAVECFVRQRRESDAAMAAFRASLDEAEASLARGEGIEGTPENIRHLLKEIDQQGRARLVEDTPAQR